MVFGSNGASHEAPPGTVRIGETIPSTFPVLISGREYTAYVWGRRMPRSQEALVRQASLDLDMAVTSYAAEGAAAHMADQKFLVVVREVLDAYRASNADAVTVAESLIKALDGHDREAGQRSIPSPLWQRYLNGVLVGIVDGLSPIQADLLDISEVRQILGNAHYPGFYTAPPTGEPEPDPQMATTTATSPTGSGSKPESPPSPISASPSNDA